VVQIRAKTSLMIQRQDGDSRIVRSVHMTVAGELVGHGCRHLCLRENHRGRSFLRFRDRDCRMLAQQNSDASEWESGLDTE
jgi:hypothetical protein